MLHPNRLASARLQAADSVEREYPYSDGAFWVGRSPFAGGRIAPEGLALGMADDRHFLLVGGTRGGKGTGYIVPNLCLWPGSIVCIDPKGENAMLTADARSEGRNGHPQAVHVLDPFGIARIVNGRLRACFNPLWELMEPDPDGEDWGTPADEDYEPAMRPVPYAVDEAATIAASIVVDGGNESNNPFWNTSARRMIGALILHVISNERFRGRRNLVTVRQLLMAGDEDLLAAAQIDNPEMTNAAAIMWNDVALNPAFDGVVHEDGAFIYDMMRNDAETYMSVAATAASHTEFLKSPQIRATLKRSSFRLEELKLSRRGVSLYLCLPMRFMNAEHYRWLRMIIGLVTQQMEKTPGPCRSGHKVLLMLDEFTSLRRMSYLEEALTGYAGHGLKMFFAVQTLDRLKAVYPDAWEGFVSQCGVKVFFNTDDHFTRKYVSDLVGETEICISSNGVTLTDSTTGGWSSTATTSHSQGGNVSDGTGTNGSKSVADNWNRSTGGGRSTGDSTGKGGGSSTGGGSSYGGGYSVGSSDSYGGGSGVSQVAYDSLLRSLFGMGPGYKPEWTVSNNSNWQHSDNFSKQENWQQQSNWGRQNNWNANHSETASEQWNAGTGGGTTVTEGVNRNHTEGRSWQESRSQAEGKSGSTTQAKAGSTTEQWSRRPIFLPEEIGRFFAGQKEQDDRYPGLALVLVGGDASMVVRRVIYHEDPHFAGLFNPHRDYKFRPIKPKIIPAPAMQATAAAALPLPISRWDRRKLRLLLQGLGGGLGFVALLVAIDSFGIKPVAATLAGLPLLLLLGLLGVVVYNEHFDRETKASRARDRSFKKKYHPPKKPQLKGDVRAYLKQQEAYDAWWEDWRRSNRAAGE